MRCVSEKESKRIRLRLLLSVEYGCALKQNKKKTARISNRKYEWVRVQKAAVPTVYCQFGALLLLLIRLRLRVRYAFSNRYCAGCKPQSESYIPKK